MPPLLPLSSGSWHTFWFNVYISHKDNLPLWHKTTLQLDCLRVLFGKSEQWWVWSQQKSFITQPKNCICRKFPAHGIEHLSYCSWSSSSFTSPAWNLSKRSWCLLGFRLNTSLSDINSEASCNHTWCSRLKCSIKTETLAFEPLSSACVVKFNFDQSAFVESWTCLTNVLRTAVWSPTTAGSPWVSPR